MDGEESGFVCVKKWFCRTTLLESGSGLKMGDFRNVEDVAGEGWGPGNRGHGTQNLQHVPHFSKSGFCLSGVIIGRVVWFRA